MEMHWHWLIVIYLFLGGLGAGAYLTSFAAEKGWLGINSQLKRIGYYIAAPVAAFGTLLLVFDLGQGLKKPWLLIGLLFNFRSVMTWGVYILAAFITIGLLKGFLVFKNKSDRAAITWAGAILALATGMYTGLLLSVIEAVPFWNSVIMPALFVVSALSTGLSVTSLLASLMGLSWRSSIREAKAHVLLITTELIIVALFLGMMSSGAKGPVGADSAKLVLFGSYAIAFWGYFIGLGLLLPLIVFSMEFLKSKLSVQKTITEPPLIGGESANVQEGHLSYLTIVTDISVLIGGFVLRVLIIFAALPIWDGVTLIK